MPSNMRKQTRGRYSKMARIKWGVHMSERKVLQGLGDSKPDPNEHAVFDNLRCLWLESCFFRVNHNLMIWIRSIHLFSPTVDDDAWYLKDDAVPCAHRHLPYFRIAYVGKYFESRRTYTLLCRWTIAGRNHGFTDGWVRCASNGSTLLVRRVLFLVTVSNDSYLRLQVSRQLITENHQWLRTCLL